MVFSATSGTWLRARVTKVDGGMVTVIYKIPDAGEATKQIPEDHEQLRPLADDTAAAQDGSAGAGGGGAQDWSAAFKSGGGRF